MTQVLGDYNKILEWINNMENILNSVKSVLGITEDYTHFDSQILMHINSTFTILNQLGIGPVEGFIVDQSSKWSNFFKNKDLQQELVKSYVYIKVRLLFDPPSSSFVLESLEKQATEYEWRLNVLVDPHVTEEGINHGS